MKPRYRVEYKTRINIYGDVIVDWEEFDTPEEAIRFVEENRSRFGVTGEVRIICITAILYPLKSSKDR